MPHILSRNNPDSHALFLGAPSGLTKRIIVLKEREQMRKDAAFLGMKKLTLENDMMAWGIQNAGRQRHASRNQPRARDVSIL
jgi:hypothetical protein